MPWMHELVLYEDKKVSAQPRQAWQVYLENKKTGRKSETFALEDPFLPEEYEDLRWYVEDFAIIDPYAVTRAAKSSGSKTAYRTALLTVLREPIDTVLDPQQATEKSREQAIHLSIHGDGTASGLHSLLWEVLESNNADEVTRQILISRICDVLDPVNTEKPLKDTKGSFNVLYVSARPDFGDDVSYRAISRYIVQLLKAKERKHTIRMHFSRPGTWAQFCKVLNSRDEGYYDLVHFDMHGSIVRSQGQHKAVLHFSPTGAATKKPDRKGADSIAKLLVKRGVRRAILNACKSASPGSSTLENLACTFTSHGVVHVVAMSYRVKTDAALLAMKNFYYALFQDPTATLTAVAYARAEMRAKPVRSGRYDLHLVCEDDFNLVFYALSKGLRSETEDLPVDLPGALHESDEDYEIEDSPRIRRIQDLDMLSLEDALSYANVISLSGESGSGKTTLAGQLREWWCETAFAEDIQYFESIEKFNDWIANRRGGDDILLASEDERDQTSIIDQRAYNFQRIIILDNIESYDPWPEDPKEAKRLELFRNTINESLEIKKGCPIIVFTRLPIEKLAPAIPDATHLQISRPSLEEAVSILMARLPSNTKQKYLQKVSDIEDIIKLHDSNLSFITEILPFSLELGYSEPYELISGLLDDPQLCVKAFNNLFKHQRSASAFELASERIASWPMQTDFAHRMILPLCMLQHRVPVDMRLWLYKLYETGAFSSSIPIIKPHPVRSGKIHDWELSDGWDSFPSNWTFEESWHKVRNCLLSLGLWTEDVGSSREYTSPSFLVHPLLPYFLCSEIGRIEGRFKDPAKYRIKIQQSFWEYYENRISDRVSLWLESVEDRMQIGNEIRADAENIFRAIELGLKQPVFPFRHIRSQSFISCLNYVSMPQPRVRRWARLFNDVLGRYESVPIGDWTLEAAGELVPPADKRKQIYADTASMAEEAGRALEALEDANAVIANGDRAVHLKNLFSPFVDTSSILTAKTNYCTQVRKARCLSSFRWTAATLEFFLELLSSDVPDLESSNSEDRAVLSRAELATHLSFQRNLVPQGHPLHQVISQYSMGLEPMISDIMLKHAGLSQLGSLGSRNLFVQSGRPDTGGVADHGHDQTSRHYAAGLCHQMQASFLRQVPSNTQGYFSDALLYAMDPEAVERGDDVIFDAKRLRQVYEKAKRVNYKGLEALCLQQLAIRAVVDDDREAAVEYLKELKDIGGEDAIPKHSLVSGDVRRQETFRKELLRKMKELELGREHDEADEGRQFGQDEEDLED